MRFKLPPPADPQEPEIAHAMIVKNAMRVPEADQIKGYVSEDDIADLAKRDRKTVLALSKIEQWNDWQTEQLVIMHGLLRQLDAEVARRKIAIAKLEVEQREQGWKWALLKWSVATIVAALLAALFRSLLGK